MFRDFVSCIALLMSCTYADYMARSVVVPLEAVLLSSMKKLGVEGVNSTC
jgi:hypothetical protein